MGKHGRGKPCHYHDTASQADACLSPSFNFIVSLLTGNVLVPLIIGIGFVFWALLGTPLSELQATRYMLAWAVDRMIPAPLGDISERFHSPVKAIIFCTVTGTLALIALVTVPQASLLGALLAQVAAFILVSVAGIVFPYRLRHVWEAAGSHRLFGIPSVTLAGIGGVIVLGSLMLMFIFNTHHSRNELGKRGIVWHTEEHERRTVDNNRAYR